MNEPIVEVVAERHIKVYLDGRVRGLGTADNITVVNRAKPLIDSLVADIKWLLDSQLSTDPRRRLIEERIRQLA